jgi:hypothetical protein
VCQEPECQAWSYDQIKDPPLDQTNVSPGG